MAKCLVYFVLSVYLFCHTFFFLNAQDKEPEESLRKNASQQKPLGNESTLHNVTPTEAAVDTAKEFAGEFFGIKVPIANYYFVKSTVLVLGTRWGAQPKTAAEIEDAVWEQLLLSYIAFNQNITVSQEEFEEEITKLLASENVSFDWKKDKPAYEKWVKEKTKESKELFENQIRHLLQIEKLRNQIIESIKPEVLDDEAYQRFFTEQSSLSIELVQFDSEKDANEFYKRVRGNPSIWEKEKKRRPKDFRQPGFVTLVFLIDIWKIPADAAQKMLQKDIGDIYPPRPIYKGFGVFKILEKRVADQSQYLKSKDPYYEKVRAVKKYEGFNAWLTKVKEEARIKVY